MPFNFLLYCLVLICSRIKGCIPYCLFPGRIVTWAWSLAKGQYGVSWPSGLAYRTQVLVLAAECGFESRPWHLCPMSKTLNHNCFSPPKLNGYLWGQSWLISTGPICAVMAAIELYSSPGSWDGFRNDVWAWCAGVIMRLEHHLVGG